MSRLKYMPYLYAIFIFSLYAILIQYFPYINDDEYYPIVMAKKYLSFERFSLNGMTFYTSSLFNFTVVPLQLILKNEVFASRITNLIFLVAASLLSYKHSKSWQTLLLMTLTPTFFFFSVNSLEAIGLLSLLVMLGLYFLKRNNLVSSIFFGLAIQLHVVSIASLLLFFTKHNFSKRDLKSFLYFLIPTFVFNCHKIPDFFNINSTKTISILNHTKFISFLFDGSLLSQIIIQDLNSMIFIVVIALTLTLGLVRRKKESLLLILIFLLTALITPKYPRVTYWCFYFFIYYSLIGQFLKRKELNILFAITICTSLFYSTQLMQRLKKWPNSANAEYLHSEYIPHRSIHYEKLNSFISKGKYQSILIHEPSHEILVPYAIYYKEMINAKIKINTTNKLKWRFTQYDSDYSDISISQKTLYISTKKKCPSQMKSISSPLKTELVFFCEGI